MRRGETFVSAALARSACSDWLTSSALRAEATNTATPRVFSARASPPESATDASGTSNTAAPVAFAVGRNDCSDPSAAKADAAALQARANVNARFMGWHEL